MIRDGQHVEVRLPTPRGPLSEEVFGALVGAPRPLPYAGRLPVPVSEDFQVTLWVLQEMTYRAVAGVDPRWEDEGSVVALRHTLERAQETELRANLFCPPTAAQDVPEAISRLVASNEGPSLPNWIQTHGHLAHERELVTHRAAGQLKAPDPHSFAIPRLEAGRAKSGLLKMQLEKYGNGEARQSQAERFAEMVRTLEVRPDIDCLPAVTLRTNTVLNTFAASRRLRGACLGHLAASELTSPEPASVPRQDLASEILAGFVEQYPREADELLFGAAALMSVEGDFSRHLIERWERGESSLRSRSGALAA